MENEKTQTGTAPAEIGAKAVAEKLDAVLSEVSAAKEAAQEATKKAQEAEAKNADLQKKLDEAVAAKNAHSVAFVDAKKEKSVKEKSAEFREFLAQVKAAKYGNKAALASATPTGSYLVDTDFLPEVLDFLAKPESLISQARRLPWGTEGNTRNIPNILARSVWANVGEGAAKPVSNPTFGNLQQVLVKAACIVVLTEELLADSSINLPALFQDQARAGLIDFTNNWLFNGNGTGHPGILGASGVLTPTVANISGLLALKQAVPGYVRANGKYFMDSALYSELAGLTRMSAPAWLYYENGVMRIDNSEVVALDASLIGARNVVFGDLNNVLFSPKNEFAVKYTDVASIVEGTGDDAVTHNLFQEDKVAYRFEMRADITVAGNTFAKATVPAQ
jgi:HK97 family phage major capsid protein